MSKRSPSRWNVEYTTYEFTASSGIDYNYDPSGSTTKPAFDPYTDTYNSPPPSSPVREDDWDSRPTRADRGRNAYLNQSRHTPSPARPPIPTSPSPEYIAESQKPSARLTVPAEARKLLILDLNGTLVYRTPHVRREFRPPRRHARAAQSYAHHQPHDQYQSYFKPYNGASNYQSHHDSRPYDPYAPPSSPTPTPTPDPGDPYADPTASRPLRTVHARPYMGAFREYLFHPHTRAWLDTMVWSSAQPHSVADMVDKCFASQQGDLLAVWARDTLGLEEKDYHRKTQTTKDLSKPWSKLPITSSSSSPSDLDTPQAHSAHTTLLMDDSPRKAHLQPYNHLCIREYTGILRQNDLQCRQHEQRAQQISSSQAASPEVDTSESTVSYEQTKISQSSEPTLATPEPTDPSLALTSDSLHHPDPNPDSSTKKRKRPKKKHPEREVADPEGELNLGLGGYDPTLLAVVGVLERIKWEGNVAGWVRGGGLAKSYLDEVHLEKGTEEYGEAQASAKAEEEKESGEDDEDLSTSASASAPQGDTKRRRVSDEHSSPPLTNGEPASLPSSPSVATLATPSPTLSVAASPLEMIGDSGQWFEDKTVLQYWVRKGVKALEGLGIEVASGIVGN